MIISLTHYYFHKEAYIKQSLKIISIRQSPAYKDQAIEYFQSKWRNVSPKIYEDCISRCIGLESRMPQWYLLMDKGGSIIGCAGLILNDSYSQMDLCPWLCALYIEEQYRGNHYCSLLIDKAKEDAKQAGFFSLYLETNQTGLYEKYGFKHVAQNSHPWNGNSRIYSCNL